MKNLEEMKMNELELESVAGGQTYWWTRITGTWTDPATGREFRDGYLVRGMNITTDQSSKSIWINASEWAKWKRTMEYRGNEFIEGDSNPNNVDAKQQS